MKPKHLYFISGVSGVGKTAVIPHLESLLSVDFEIHDFDEGGVPSGADHVWRIGRTREWISFGNQKSMEGITLIVCGVSNPDEIETVQKDFPGLDVKTILLDGDEKIIEQRLRGRNNDSNVKADLERVVGSAEAFIENNTRFASVLREICKKHNCDIIDTTYVDPKTVAEKVVEVLEK